MLLHTGYRYHEVSVIVVMVLVALTALCVSPSEQVNVFMPDDTLLVRLDEAVDRFAKQQVTDNLSPSDFHDEGNEHGVTTLLLQPTYRDSDAGPRNAGTRYQWDNEFIDPPHVSIVGVWETASDDEQQRQVLKLLPPGQMQTSKLDIELNGEAVVPLTFPEVRSHRQGLEEEAYGDSADSIPYLNVVYICKDSNSRALIRMAVPVHYVGRERGGTSASYNTTAVAYWTKTCGVKSTRRLGLTVGYNTEKIVDDGIVIGNWGNGASPPTIDYEQRSTQFTIFMDGKHGTEFYPTPVIMVHDPSVLTAKIGGEAAEGFVVDRSAKRIIVYYQCLSDGSTRIQLALTSTLFKLVQLTWIKQCGIAENQGTIDVGTHAQTPNDVVLNGTAHIEWSFSRPTLVLREDVRSSVFYVSTAEDSIKVHFSAPIVTVTPANAMQVVVSGNMQYGGIATTSPQQFVLTYVCSRRIDVTARVTLQLEHHGLVEFGFQKKCVYRPPKEGVTFTANELLVMMSLSTMFISVFVWYYWFRRTKLYRLFIDEFCFC